MGLAPELVSINSQLCSPTKEAVGYSTAIVKLVDFTQQAYVEPLGTEYKALSPTKQLLLIRDIGLVYFRCLGVDLSCLQVFRLSTLQVRLGEGQRGSVGLG